MFGRPVTPVPVATPIRNGIDLPKRLTTSSFFGRRRAASTPTHDAEGHVGEKPRRGRILPDLSRPPGRKSEPGGPALGRRAAAAKSPNTCPSKTAQPRRYSPSLSVPSLWNARAVESQERRSLPPEVAAFVATAVPGVISSDQPSRAALAEATLVGGSVEGLERGTHSAQAVNAGRPPPSRVPIGRWVPAAGNASAADAVSSHRSIASSPHVGR